MREIDEQGGPYYQADIEQIAAQERIGAPDQNWEPDGDGGGRPAERPQAQAPQRKLSAANATLPPTAPHSQYNSAQPETRVSLLVSSHRTGEIYSVNTPLTPKGFHGISARGMGARRLAMGRWMGSSKANRSQMRQRSRTSSRSYLMAGKEQVPHAAAGNDEIAEACIARLSEA